MSERDSMLIHPLSAIARHSTQRIIIFFLHLFLEISFAPDGPELWMRTCVRVASSHSVPTSAYGFFHWNRWRRHSAINSHHKMYEYKIFAKIETFFSSIRSFVDGARRCAPIRVWFAGFLCRLFISFFHYEILPNGLFCSVFRRLFFSVFGRNAAMGAYLCVPALMHTYKMHIHRESRFRCIVGVFLCEYLENSINQPTSRSSLWDRLASVEIIIFLFSKQMKESRKQNELDSLLAVCACIRCLVQL